jgi:hypothetical protein
MCDASGGSAVESALVELAGVQEGTYGWIEHGAADVSEDADVDGESDAKGERDVDELWHGLDRAQVEGVWVCVFDCGGYDGDWGSSKGEEEKHEGADKLSNEDGVFMADVSVREWRWDNGCIVVVVGREDIVFAVLRHFRDASEFSRFRIHAKVWEGLETDRMHCPKLLLCLNLYVFLSDRRR